MFFVSLQVPTSGDISGAETSGDRVGPSAWMSGRHQLCHIPLYAQGAGQARLPAAEVSIIHEVAAG